MNDPDKFDLAKIRHELAGVIQGLRTGTKFAPDGQPGINPKLLDLSLEKLLSITQRIDAQLARDRHAPK